MARRWSAVCSQRGSGHDLYNEPKGLRNQSISSPPEPDRTSLLDSGCRPRTSIALSVRLNADDLHHDDVVSASPLTADRLRRYYFFGNIDFLIFATTVKFGSTT